MITPAGMSIPKKPDGTLADLRVLISRRPEALYADAEKLAEALNASPVEVEAAVAWLVEDGLEVMV